MNDKSIHLQNTMTRRKEPFESIEPGVARMYTCGPTVYNFAHIGNFRAYVFEDLLRRTLELFGYDVVQVMNLTDVDDKTIRDSHAAGSSLNAYTARYKEAFFEDLSTLNIEKAEHYPAATDHVPEMIALIEALMEKGVAYQADDGSVYFSIAKFPDYGKLARIDMKNQIAGERVKNDEYAKDSIADFALWKAWDSEDGDVAWDSPWGRGRPGWHVECSAMSMKYLGETFDIHTGGIDNMFPHHEDEIAQSESATGRRYVNYWLHCEYLIVEGRKMSKSLGNFFTIRDLLDRGWSGDEIRWTLISSHYRKKLNFSLSALEEARVILGKFRDLFDRLRGDDERGDVDDEEVSRVVGTADESFRAGLADDLNVSQALAAVFGLETSCNKWLTDGGLSTSATNVVLDQFRRFDRVLGLLRVDESSDDEAVPAEIQEMAERRSTARGEKDFALADKLRDELKDRGWVVEDTPNGPRVKKA